MFMFVRQSALLRQPLATPRMCSGHTLGLAVGRCCGCGRDSVSGYNPCLLDVPLA